MATLVRNDDSGFFRVEKPERSAIERSYFEKMDEPLLNDLRALHLKRMRDQWNRNGRFMAVDLSQPAAPRDVFVAHRPPTPADGALFAETEWRSAMRGVADEPFLDARVVVYRPIDTSGDHTGDAIEMQLHCPRSRPRAVPAFDPQHPPLLIDDRLFADIGVWNWLRALRNTDQSQFQFYSDAALTEPEGFDTLGSGAPTTIAINRHVTAVRKLHNGAVDASWQPTTDSTEFPHGIVAFCFLGVAPFSLPTTLGLLASDAYVLGHDKQQQYQGVNRLGTLVPPWGAHAPPPALGRTEPHMDWGKSSWVNAEGTLRFVSTLEIVPNNRCASVEENLERMRQIAKLHAATHYLWMRANANHYRPPPVAPSDGGAREGGRGFQALQREWDEHASKQQKTERGALPSLAALRF